MDSQKEIASHSVSRSAPATEHSRKPKNARTSARCLSAERPAHEIVARTGRRDLELPTDEGEELIAGGQTKADAFKQLAEEYGQPVNSIRGSYYQHTRGKNGEGAKPRRRETTPEDALADARAALERAIASENIDATPAGRLMHGMLATFAEYYSNNLATEIKKGLTQKHLDGGTPFKPPIGYLSKREIISGQDIRGVEIDPERAPLIKLAFDLYATGDWSLHRLAEHLKDRGLVSIPTPKRPAAPLRFTSLHKLMGNPYYHGIVVYAGRRVVGRHQPLIDKDTFDLVQARLTSRAIGGDFHPQVAARTRSG